MQEHSRYEELCAAAGVGQISPDELRELRAHAADCDICKELQSEFVEISSVWLTQTQKLEPELYDPQSALRKSILRKLQDAGAKFSAPVRKEIQEQPHEINSFGWGSFRLPAQVWIAALIIAACAVGFGAGSFGHYSYGPEKVAATAPTTATPPISIKTPINVTDNTGLLAVRQAEADFQQKLAASEAEKRRLEDEVNAMGQKIAALQGDRARDASALAQLQATAYQRQAASASAEAQMQNLRDKNAVQMAELAQADVRLSDLQGKLARQVAAEERDRQLLALSSDSEVRDVIASRSLHIIDVADVDNSGLRKPFGRVFYTEGKSLIFYAYDLSKTKGSQTFYAWGHREGDPHLIRALGALHNDDPAQGRWVFRFNDTKVLAQIDSVYVTLEPNEHPGDKPRGKEMLYAFLGTRPNHP